MRTNVLFLLAKALRQYLAGGDCRFVFRRTHESALSPLDSAHLYLHVPFCSSECPYCPYNKIPFQPTVADQYVEALHAEIRLVRARVGPLRAPSLYVGGGTPMLLGHRFAEVIDCVRNAFDLDGPVAVEVTPADFSEKQVEYLQAAGATMVSVGVQSFQEATLQTIGRLYPGPVARRALQQLAQAGFDTVNADLMFAVPGQTQAQLSDDLEQAVACGASQVTTYPLFTFPYSTAARHRRQRSLRLPSLPVRYRQYRHIWQHFHEHDFAPASVWSFRKGRAAPYSSVTRKVYVGLGAGAATCIPGHYSFNTFDVPAYMAQLGRQRLPVALHMNTTRRLEDWYWLYWQMYQTRIDKNALRKRFKSPGPSPYAVLELCKLMRWIQEDEAEYRMTEAGAFWIHLAQNYLLLGSIDRLWQRAMAEPFPQSVAI